MTRGRGAEGNISTVRRFMNAIRHGELDDACALLHKDFVAAEAGGLPYSGDYHGPRGFAELLAAMTEILQLDAGPSIQDSLADGTVVSRFQLKFTARATGRSAEMGIVELYTFRDNSIVKLDVFYKDPLAVTALLDPPHSEPNANE